MEQPGWVSTAAAYALVLVLVVLCTLWGAFLVPLRVGGTLVPVSLVIVVAANTGLGLASGRLLGRPGAGTTALLWLLIAFTLGARRPEGDLVISSGWVGLGYLVLGAVSAAVGFGVTPSKRLRHRA